MSHIQKKKKPVPSHLSEEPVSITLKPIAHLAHLLSLLLVQVSFTAQFGISSQPKKKLTTEFRNFAKKEWLRTHAATTWAGIIQVKSCGTFWTRDLRVTLASHSSVTTCNWLAH